MQKAQSEVGLQATTARFARLESLWFHFVDTWRVRRLDVKYAKWSIKYAEIHVFSGCEQIHSKYTVKYTGRRHVIVTAATS